MTSQVDYTANGSIVAFPYPFAIPAKSALEVRINDVVQDVGFVVTGAGSADGGNVVFGSAPADGLAISLRYLGAVTITAQDASAGHLSDKLIAGAGISLETITEPGGVQRIKLNADEAADSLEKDQNLADLPDKAQARTNLGVYSKAEVEARDQAVKDAALLKVNNLSDLTDTAAARSNLGVYGKTEVDAKDQAVKDAALLKANNLSDLTDMAAARGNLGVYGKAEVDAKDQAVRDAALLKANNLSDLTDVAAARGNLGVYSTGEVDGAITAAQPDLSTVLRRNVPVVVEAGFWSKPVVLSVTGGTATPDPLAGTVFTLPVSAATILGFPSGMAGKAGMMLVVATQDSTGGHTLTLAAGYALASGEWSTEAGAVNLLWITSDGSGTALDVVISQRGV